jgi:hypothetical protein
MGSRRANFHHGPEGTLHTEAGYTTAADPLPRTMPGGRDPQDAREESIYASLGCGPCLDYEAGHSLELANVGSHEGEAMRDGSRCKPQVVRPDQLTSSREVCPHARMCASRRKLDSEKWKSLEHRFNERRASSSHARLRRTVNAMQQLAGGHD